MSDNLFIFPGSPIIIAPATEVNEGLVAALEDLLARAKEGQVLGVAYACIEKDNLAYTYWNTSGEREYLDSAVMTLFSKMARG